MQLAMIAHSKLPIQCLLINFEVVSSLQEKYNFGMLRLVVGIGMSNLLFCVNDTMLAEFQMLKN